MDPVLHRIIFPFGIVLVLFALLLFRYRRRRLSRIFFAVIAAVCLCVTVYYALDLRRDDVVTVTAVMVEDEKPFKEPGYCDVHFAVTDTGEKISVCMPKKQMENVLADTVYEIRYAARTGMLIDIREPVTETVPEEESTSDEAYSSDVSTTAP
jgi:hypothetical protein